MVSYYTILEVDERATGDEIKRSYHRLALRYHPDKAGPEGAGKFKEISTAYQVLSDPQKRAVYDKYGETGLDAMDNPAQTAVPLEAMNSVVMTLLVLLLLTAIMVLIFLSFLGAYVDGHLSSSWNYVKVFSPLFAADVLIGVPAAILMLAAPLLIRGSVGVAFAMVCLCVVCSVLLTILIPICKDRNEKRMAAGRTDFLKWRVWLIPGYQISLAAFTFVIYSSFPSSSKRQKCKVYGLKHLANYLPVSFVLRVIAVWCIPVFFALIGCRADELIHTNYFVIIGVPAFVAAFCLVIDFIVTRVLLQVLTRVEEPDENKHHDNNRNSNSSGHAHRHDADASSASAHANSESRNANANEFSLKDDKKEKKDRSGSSGSSTANPTAAEPVPTTVLATHSCCRILLQIFAFLLLIGLLLASAAMISVRLNYYNAHATYTGVLSLGKALIPLYMVVGLIVLFLIVAVPMFCCVGSIARDAASQEKNEEEQGQQEQHQEMGAAEAAAAPAPPTAAHRQAAEQPDPAIILLDNNPRDTENAEGARSKNNEPFLDEKKKSNTNDVDHID